MKYMMTMFKPLLRILFTMFVISSAAAQSDSFISAPPIPAPVMDGKTSSLEWQAAAQVTGWADSILGMANNDKTMVALGHSSGTLYVRFICPIPEKFRLNKVVYVSCPLKMTASKKEENILQDDYVGIYLTPPGKRDLYFMGVNGAGITCDSVNGDNSWKGQWQVKQSLNDFFWTLEFAVPLKQFGAATDEKQNWGINFAHGGRRIEPLESIWAFQPAKLRSMAKMRLSSRAVAAVISGLGNLPEGSLALKGRIENLTKAPYAGTRAVTVFNLADNKTVFGPEKTELNLAPGKNEAIKANYNVNGSICGKVVIAVKDKQGNPLLDYNLPFVFAREIGLETRWIITPAILQLVLDAGSPGNLKKITGGQVKIISADTKKTVLTQALPKLKKVISITSMNCSKLPVGCYNVEIELNMGGAATVLKSKFEKEPAPEWLGNKIGFSDKVPAPWQPLKMENSKKALDISCWGRQYAFGAAGFPSQIKVLDKDILAGPVKVVVKCNGKKEVLPFGKCQVTEKKDTRITFKTVARAAGIKITADTWIEFDGFVWNTFKVQSDTPAEIEELSIEIPLKKEYATLWWHKTLCRGMLRDEIGSPPQKPSAGKPMNFLRLGDEERGIQFMYESLRNWNPKPGHGQELIPGKKSYTLRYNLIGKKTRLKKPLDFSLGYIALPSKPRSELFRRVNVDRSWSGGRKWASKELLDKNNWLFQTYLFGSGWFGRRDSNYYKLWEESVFDKDCLKKFKGKRAPLWEKMKFTNCMYYQACVNDANTPEYRKYRFEWKEIPGNAPYVPADPKTRDTVVLASVCHQSKSYVDFQVWCMDKVLRYLSDNGKVPIHGYQDCGRHRICSNTLHGCPADGHIPILANREWAKRIYIMYKSINPLNQLCIHTGGESAMNWCSFFDMVLEGEQFSAAYRAALVRDPSLPKNYTKLFNLKRFRAQCQTYAWGPERYFLTQFWDWMRNDPDGALPCMGHLWGLTFCHDVAVVGSDTPTSIVRGIAELGWDDKTEFIPYWRKGTGIETKFSSGQVVASAWKRGKGNLLVIVFNDSAKPAKGELVIDFSRFGFKPGNIKCRDYGAAGLAYPDAPFSWNHKTQKGTTAQQLKVVDTISQSGKTVPVEIGQHSFRLLRFYQ